MLNDSLFLEFYLSPLSLSVATRIAELVWQQNFEIMLCEFRILLGLRWPFLEDPAGEIKASTSTVAALFSKMALTGQRIAMVDIWFCYSFSSISNISTVGVDGARASL